MTYEQFGASKKRKIMSIVIGKMYVCDRCGKSKFVEPSEITGTQTSAKHHYVKYNGIDFASVGDSYCFCKECLDKYVVEKNKFLGQTEEDGNGSL